MKRSGGERIPWDPLLLSTLLLLLLLLLQLRLSFRFRLDEAGLPLLLVLQLLPPALLQQQIFFRCLRMRKKGLPRE